MRPFAQCLLALCLPLAPASAQRQGAATITPADIAARVGVLADDSMGGRFTPSPELDRAADYVAAEFARFGLEPAGDSGGFIQRYTLEQPVPDTAGSFITIGRTRIRFGTDAIPWAAGGTVEPVTGRTVLVTGMLPPRRGLDLEGAIVIAAVGTDGTGQPTAQGRAVLRAITQANPAAVLIPVDSPDEVWPTVVSQRFRTVLAPAWLSSRGIPHVEVRDRAIGPALGAVGVDLGVARQSTGEVQTRPLDLPIIVVSRTRAAEATTAPNVAALLRGADPVLRDEVIVVSAHMDHVGVTGRGRCRAVGADSICNGADDNASGTVSVIELAEAFATQAPRPRRSILFLTVSGEERGMWGSDYFAAHPPVPIDQLVADINLDMVGRNWPDTIVAIGREHSDLGTTLGRVEAAHPELRMTVRDDPWPNERFYYRSDHYNFARRGVPVLFFFNGTHVDYHRPSDHPDKIDAEKQARLTQLVFYLVDEIANAPTRPQWVPRSYREIVDSN
ncbi:MAG: M28 family peptidase [Gemmatimonadota bacterium]|nr:M28 family peptidase [Gemmatimonadota bacterium]